jgi:UrcA family protein
MNNAKRNKLLPTTLLVMSCSIPLAGTAAIKTNAVGERTVSVTMADLNLAEPQGVSVLFRRLQRAADDVCGSRHLLAAGSLKQRQLNQHCYAQTLGKAVREIGNAELTELHARSKRLP